MTFSQARAAIHAELRSRKWKVFVRDSRTGKNLKTTYAVSPNGQMRVYFKPQAVYLAIYPEPARSLWLDIRALSPAEFVNRLEDLGDPGW